MANIQAKYSGGYFDLENLPVVTKSLRETVFSNIKIDFSDKPTTSLPIQYQQIQIVDRDEVPEKVLMSGFINSYKLNQPFDGKQFRRLLEIEFLSPQSYANLRSRSLVLNETTLKEAVIEILQPLTDDGYNIEDNNLTEQTISVKYVISTVEKIMNDMSNKYKFFWYIDENKKIYLNMIDAVQDSEPALVIDDVTSNSLLKEISPSLTSAEYANKINVKNARVYETDFEAFSPKPAINNGEIYTFKYNIDVSENAGTRIIASGTTTLVTLMSLSVGSDLGTIQYNKSTNTYTVSSNIGYDGEDNNDSTKKFLLVTDKLLPYIVTGFKWNGTSTTINQIFSESYLLSTSLIYTDPAEIVNASIKITPSGIVEKVIDVNQRIFTTEEIVQFAKSQVTLNNAATREVSIVFRGETGGDIETLIDDLQIGSVIAIDLPDLLTEGNFVITDTQLITETFNKNIKMQCRNSDLIENYVNIFRKTEIEENENQEVRQIQAVYITDESMEEVHEIKVDGDVVNEV